jgi:hypothetical protein
VNNVIDKNLIAYYLINIAKIDKEILIKDFVYKLDILDNEANMISLTEKDSIIINKNDYKISHN